MNRSPFRLVYTAEEVADLFGIFRSSMYERIRVGDVATVRLGRRLFVTVEAVTAITGVQPPSPAELAKQRSASAS